MFFSLSIFAQSEEKEQLVLNDLYDALEKSGMEYVLEMVSNDLYIVDGLSIEEFLPILESWEDLLLLDSATLTDYDCSNRTWPYYYCDADVSGGDWDGVRHRLHTYGTSNYWAEGYTAYPDEDIYNWTFSSTSGLQGCGQLYNNSLIWIPGVGGLPGHWATIKVFFGSELCDYIYFNY